MLLWFADLVIVTEEVAVHRPNVSTLLSSAFIRGDLNAATRGPFKKEKDPDRLVLSADKGNCVVVMDKQQYHDKALSLLNDKRTYAVLNSDPTSKTPRKLNKILLDLKKAGKISDSKYKKCYTVVTAYVHVFIAYLKFINQEFL